MLKILKAGHSNTLIPAVVSFKYAWQPLTSQLDPIEFTFKHVDLREAIKRWDSSRHEERRGAQHKAGQKDMTETSMRENLLIFFLSMQHKLSFVMYL